MGRIADKVAVITGGASGIGAAAAEKLLGEGAYVVLGDIQEQAGADMVAALGDRSRFKVCDVTKEDQVEALIQSAVDEFGRIDVMFNNAGIVGALGPLESTTAEEWQFTLDILLNGVFYGMKHASKHMKQARSGSIISRSVLLETWLQKSVHSVSGLIVLRLIAWRRQWWLRPIWTITPTSMRR